MSLISNLISFLFSILQSSYLIYAFRAFVVVLFWFFLARKHLFAAAILQIIGYSLYANYVVPVIPNVFGFTLGQGFALVLLVEAFRQGLHKRVMTWSGGATFVKLRLMLFSVSMASYFLKGAADFSDPVGSLINEFANEVAPVCIIALAVNWQELSQAWEAGMWASGIIAGLYLLSGIFGMFAGQSGIDLRQVKVLQYGIGGGAGIVIWFILLSAYAPCSWEQGHPKIGTLFALAFPIGAFLVVLSATRNFVLLLLLSGILMLFVRPTRKVSKMVPGLMIAIWALGLAGSLVVCFFPGFPGKVAESYDTLVQRFEGEYGAETGSGRFDMWERAWQLFLEEPVLGAGEGNSGILQSTYLEEEQRLHTFRVAQHSLYLKYLGEQGLIGGGLLFLIIVLFFANARLVFCRLYADENILSIARGAFVIGIVGLIGGLFGGGLMVFLGAALMGSLRDAQLQPYTSIHLGLDSSQCKYIGRHDYISNDFQAFR